MIDLSSGKMENRTMFWGLMWLQAATKTPPCVYKTKKYLKFPGCRYSLGPAASRGEQRSQHPAFPDRSCCFWIAVGSEAPSCNPRIFCQLCLFRTAATAEAGSESHAFICFPSWKTCDKTASRCAGGIKKTTLSKALFPICQWRRHEIPFTT